MKEVQSGVRSGNAAEDTADPALRKWLVGNFANAVAPVPSKAVEVKYGMHQAGEQRSEAQATADKKFTSLGILIQGRVSYWFKEEDGTINQVTVEKQGDYVVWGPGVLHWWAIEADDTVILTFRFVEQATN